MRPLLFRISILAIVVLLAVAGDAAAQGTAKARAKQLVDDGLAAVDAGRYDDGIALYDEAYELVPHPEVLFLLARAHRLKGDRATALRYYEQYLAIDANGRSAKEARRWIETLEKEVAA